MACLRERGSCKESAIGQPVKLKTLLITYNTITTQKNRPSRPVRERETYILRAQNNRPIIFFYRFLSISIVELQKQISKLA